MQCGIVPLRACQTVIKWQSFRRILCPLFMGIPTPSIHQHHARPSPNATLQEAKPAVAVSAAQVKALRESTGAGMMDCKKALAENGGDEAAAAEVRGCN